jgi:hypothetical protein
MFPTIIFPTHYTVGVDTKYTLFSCGLLTDYPAVSTARSQYNLPVIMATAQGAISKRRKFVADGVFYAELNEFFQRELAEEGYSGVEVRVTPTVTDISMFSPVPQA